MFCKLKGVRGDLIVDEVVRVLDSVSLLNVKDHTVSSFSGGMRRRISLAIALISNP